MEASARPMGNTAGKPVKKKLLFLLEAFDKGGIEKVTLDIVNSLDPKQYDITVQTFWFGGYCQSQVHDNVKVIPFFFRRYVRGIIRLIEYLPPKLLYRLFVHGEYDVEIAASDGGAAKVISGSTNKKAKKVCWVHMDVMKRGSQLKEFRNAETAKPIYSKFDVIVPVSEACADSFREKFGPDYSISVKRNPLPVDEILRKSSEPFSFANAGGVKMACIGRLVEQKGFDRLLIACRRLIDDGISDFNVHIAGDGPKRAELEQTIHKLGLQENVHLYGYCSNPYSMLRQADVFVLSSRDEAFSLVVGESLIAGTPVVATDCCGVREWLEDDKYGMIVQNSIDGIYAGLSAILQNPEILSRYRAKIPEAQKRLSFQKALSDFEEVLV